MSWRAQQVHPEFGRRGAPTIRDNKAQRLAPARVGGRPRTRPRQSSRGGALWGAAPPPRPHFWTAAAACSNVHANHARIAARQFFSTQTSKRTGSSTRLGCTSDLMLRVPLAWHRCLGRSCPRPPYQMKSPHGSVCAPACSRLAASDAAPALLGPPAAMPAPPTRSAASDLLESPPLQINYSHGAAGAPASFRAAAAPAAAPCHKARLHILLHIARCAQDFSMPVNVSVHLHTSPRPSPRPVAIPHHHLQDIKLLRTHVSSGLDVLRTRAPVPH